MATINKTRAEQVRTLYEDEQLSAREIAEKLRVSIDAVYYAMRKHSIKRRAQRENSRLAFSRKPLSYSVKKNLSKLEEKLKVAAVMLYWAEGYKTKKSAGIDLANSDVATVQLFLRFLREVCHVDEGRIRIFLYCYSNQQPQVLMKFWSEVLNVPLDQFPKPYVRTDFRVEKSSKMPYGLVHVRYMDKKLLQQMLEWIEEYKKYFCVGTQAVNGDGL